MRWNLESSNWTTKLDDVWKEHGVDELNLAAREVQFIWHVYLGALAVDIKKRIQTYLNGQDSENIEERIIMLSMFNDIDWT